MESVASALALKRSLRTLATFVRFFSLKVAVVTDVLDQRTILQLSTAIKQTRLFIQRQCQFFFIGVDGRIGKARLNIIQFMVDRSKLCRRCQRFLPNGSPQRQLWLLG